MGQSLIYNDQLSAAYSKGSLTASKLSGKHIVLLHNGGTLYRDIEKRLVTEGTEVTLFDYTNKGQSPEVTDSDIVTIAVEWEIKTELLRLKSVSKEMYDDFFQSQVSSLHTALATICEKNQIKKIIVVLPSFAFEAKYGFTLYGMAAEWITRIIDTEIRTSDTHVLNVHYGKTLKAKAETKADIYRKTGLLRHVLLREQVSALVAFMSSPVGNRIKQEVINIGVSAE